MKDDDQRAPHDAPNPDEPDDEQEQDKPLGRDERVSLYGVDPAEALRAYMRTPRVQGKKR